MENIRDDKGIVLSEEQKKKIEEIINSRQSEIDKIVTKKEKSVRGFFSKTENPQQKIVDEMIKKQQANNENER